MLLAVPMLITIAIHFMDLLHARAAWWGFIGEVLAIGGAVILAVDKGSLCLVPSAFDTLSETDFTNLPPWHPGHVPVQGLVMDIMVAPDLTPWLHHPDRWTGALERHFALAKHPDVDRFDPDGQFRYRPDRIGGYYLPWDRLYPLCDAPDLKL